MIATPGSMLAYNSSHIQPAYHSNKVINGLRLLRMPEGTSKASQSLNGTSHCFKTWPSNCKDTVSAAKLLIIFEEPDPRDRERSNRISSATPNQGNRPLFGQRAACAAGDARKLL